jgi:hypothetical protein
VLVVGLKVVSMVGFVILIDYQMYMEVMEDKKWSVQEM